jgi:hypothetical protein
MNVVLCTNTRQAYDRLISCKCMQEVTVNYKYKDTSVTIIETDIFPVSV